MAKKKKGLKVGQSRTTFRKIGKKRVKVKITKKSGGKYSVKRIGKKKK